MLYVLLKLLRASQNCIETDCQQFLEAIGSRQPSFLAHEAWSRMLPAKSVKDELLDIVAEISTVMQRYDRLKATDTARLVASDIESVHAAYLDHIDRLAHWHRTNIPLSIFSYEPSTMLRRKGTEHFVNLCPRKRQYSALKLAELDTIYATVQLMVHLELLDLANFVIATGTLQTQHHSLLFRAGTLSSRPVYVAQLDAECALREARSWADTIVESMEYFLEQEVGVLAASSTVLPIIVGVAFLQKLEDPKAAYLMAIICEYQKRSGVRLADLVMEGLGLGIRDEGEAMRWKDIAYAGGSGSP